jgi:polyisoprenoid-binding protein YceI
MRGAARGFLLALLLGGAVQAASSEGPRAGSWSLDSNRGHVGFTVTKLGFTDVEGHFTKFSGEVFFDAARPENSSIRWRVSVRSVQTDDPRRDASLQNAEYFDSARHPDLSFVSDRVRQIDGGRFEVTGRVTIKGRTQPLTIIAAPAGAGFETRFDLDRYDFGLVGGPVMGRLIGRTVRVRLVAMPAYEP